MNHVMFYQNVNPELDMNIVIDLDETIIHCIQTNIESYYNELIEMENCMYTFMIDDVNHVMFIRPYLFQFLNNLRDKFNVYISTHAHEEYAKYVVKYLSFAVPNLKICGVHYRVADTLSINDKKTLNIFGLSHHNTIIIDDRCDVWNMNYHNNIINIKKYLGPYCSMNVDDDHLWTVEQYINYIHKNYITNSFHVNIYLPQIMNVYHTYNNEYESHNISNIYKSEDEKEYDEDYECDLIFDVKTKLIDLDKIDINEIENELNQKLNNMMNNTNYIN